MSRYKSPLWRQLVVVASFLAFMLPAIALAGGGYFWFVEQVLGLDTRAKPQGMLAGLLIVLGVLPMVFLMLVAILISSIMWMAVMACLLSWPDLEFYTNQKGPRVAWISDWLEKVWLRLIEPKRPGGSGDESM